MNIDTTTCPVLSIARLAGGPSLAIPTNAGVGAPCLASETWVYAPPRALFAAVHSDSISTVPRSPV